VEGAFNIHDQFCHPGMKIDMTSATMMTTELRENFVDFEIKEVQEVKKKMKQRENNYGSYDYIVQNLPPSANPLIFFKACNLCGKSYKIHYSKKNPNFDKHIQLPHPFSVHLLSYMLPNYQGIRKSILKRVYLVDLGNFTGNSAVSGPQSLVLVVFPGEKFYLFFCQRFSNPTIIT